MFKLFNWLFKHKSTPTINSIINYIDIYLNSVSTTSQLDKKSIRICKKICYKIINDGYRLNRNKLKTKWGDIEQSYDTISDINLKSDYEKELIYSLNLDDQQKQRYSNLLFKILAKYYKYLDKELTTETSLVQ
jgi:hypothetical protein